MGGKGRGRREKTDKTGRARSRREGKATYFIDMMKEVGGRPAGWAGRHTVVCPARQGELRWSSGFVAR